MFNKHKSLFSSVLTIILGFVFTTIYNIYSISDVSAAATATLSTSGTVNIDVSAAGNSANIGTDILTVDTTCSTGYTVTIQSSINDATLYKDGDSTSTSKIAPSTGTISAPASILGNNLGTWGYSMTSSAVTGTFTGLNSTPAIIKQSTTASATGGDQFPVYYGVSVTPTLEPGAYTMANDPNNGNNPATIVYQLTTAAACNPYVIKYNGNNNDAGTTMSITHELELNDSTDLAPSNFKRAGYGFAGWNTKADGTGTDFGPMEDVTLSTTDTKGNALIQAADQNKEITLYAKWIQSAGNIQGWTGCDSMNTGDVTALTDTRDNNTYAVAKLADGNCWMIENLRLGSTAATTLTPTNSNITANFTLSASVNPEQTAWCEDWQNATCINQSMLNADNTTNSVALMTGTDDKIYSYGNYYNWYSATAGTRSYNDGIGNAPGSICPIGWHLPAYAGTNTDFKKLVDALEPSGNYVDPARQALLKYPNNFISSGFVSGSTFELRGVVGDYWSASAGNETNAYALNFIPGYVYPGTSYYAKRYGFTVRCMANKVAYLDTGSKINTKLKSLASGTNVTNDSTNDTLITAFVRSDTLPDGFTPSSANTISSPNSLEPVYVWFDSNNGTIYYYSRASEIWMRAYSDYLFYRMRSLTDISGLKYWKVDNVTDMGYMFNTTKISDLTPLTNWKVDNVTDMDYMFAYTPISNPTPLTNWNVSNVTNMGYMFQGAQISDLTPIANWKVDNVTDMSGMFWGAQISNLTPLANWNISKVTNMYSMFQGAQISDLTPLANWNVSEVTNMAAMFYNTQISDLAPLTNWKVDNVTGMGSMFGSTGISNLTPLTNWKVDNVTDMVGMFNSTKISDLTPIANWKVDNVTRMGDMFWDTQISDLTPLANWNVSKVTSMGNMFNTTKISDLTPIANWDVSNVTNMSHMFYSVPTLTNATPIAGWNVNSVGPNTAYSGFASMFGGSTPKTNLPIFTSRPGTWDTNGTYTPNP